VRGLRGAASLIVGTRGEKELKRKEGNEFKKNKSPLRRQLFTRRRGRKRSRGRKGRSRKPRELLKLKKKARSMRGGGKGKPGESLAAREVPETLRISGFHHASTRGKDFIGEETRREAPGARKKKKIQNAKVTASSDGSPGKEVAAKRALHFRRRLSNRAV